MATLELAGGRQMPVIAFGTGTKFFKGLNNVQRDLTVTNSVKAALQAGFRHIDCAEMYGNELDVGPALKASEIPREELFITSKIHPDNYNPPDRIASSLKRSLEKLSLTYLDLYLLHAPFTPHSLNVVWHEMEELVNAGLVRAIGVSNFRIQDLEQILEQCRIRPAVNQIELHPYLARPDLVAFCQSKGIHVGGYSALAPLNRHQDGPVDPVVKQLAEKYNKTPAQILLKWSQQQAENTYVVTTTSNPQRLQEYLEVPLFRLEKEELEEITTAGKDTKARFFWAKDFQAGEEKGGN